MTELIKRDDALAAIDTFKRDFEQSWKVQFGADIKALPAVPTHRYAGESEASVYDRKGFPPIEIVNDPTAIREAALQARIEQLVKERDESEAAAKIWQEDFIQENKRLHMAMVKAAIAVVSLREIIICWDAPSWKDVDQQARAMGNVINRARAVLAELEKTE